MCLLKGKVKIYKSGVGGRTQIIRMIRPIQYFGYRAFFAREPYVTAASAFESSTVCLISMELIENMLRKNGNLALFFIRCCLAIWGRNNRWVQSYPKTRREGLLNRLSPERKLRPGRRTVQQ